MGAACAENGRSRRNCDVLAKGFIFGLHAEISLPDGGGSELALVCKEILSGNFDSESLDVVLDEGLKLLDNDEFAYVCGKFTDSLLRKRESETEF